jgi:hypothetical protein
VSRVIAFFRGRLWLWEFSALGWLLLLPYIMSAHGHLDWSGHALGRDFVNYWSAGQMVREGHVAPIFDRDGFLAAEHRLFDPRLPFHFWSYPPVALFLVAPLGWLPYVPALIAWSVAGVVALVPTARRFLPDPREAVLLVACPATAIDIALGQNGALTAALLIGGLALWDTRPRTAGALLGLLIFKPQMALMLPVAVIAERRWITMGVAVAVALGLLLLSAPVFGLNAWRGYLTNSLVTQQLMLSQGTGPFQWMMPTVLMSARLLGLPFVIAMTLQAIFSLIAVCMVWSAWRGDADREAKAALLMAATFMASPQSFNYDLIPAACAALVLWRRDRSSVGQALALAVWGLPIVMITLQAVDGVGERGYLVKPLMMLSPLALTGVAWRLYRLCRPSAAASASTAGEAASNT